MRRINSGNNAYNDRIPVPVDASYSQFAALTSINRPSLSPQRRKDDDNTLEHVKDSVDKAEEILRKHREEDSLEHRMAEVAKPFSAFSESAHAHLDELDHVLESSSIDRQSILASSTGEYEHRTNVEKRPKVNRKPGKDAEIASWKENAENFIEKSQKVVENLMKVFSVYKANFRKTEDRPLFQSLVDSMDFMRERVENIIDLVPQRDTFFFSETLLNADGKRDMESLLKKLPSECHETLIKLNKLEILLYNLTKIDEDDSNDSSENHAKEVNESVKQLGINCVDELNDDVEHLREENAQYSNYEKMYESKIPEPPPAEIPFEEEIATAEQAQSTRQVLNSEAQEPSAKDITTQQNWLDMVDKNLRLLNGLQENSSTITRHDYGCNSRSNELRGRLLDRSSWGSNHLKMKRWDKSREKSHPFSNKYYDADPPSPLNPHNWKDQLNPRGRKPDSETVANLIAQAGGCARREDFRGRKRVVNVHENVDSLEELALIKEDMDDICEAFNRYSSSIQEEPPNSDSHNSPSQDMEREENKSTSVSIRNAENSRGDEFARASLEATKNDEQTYYRKPNEDPGEYQPSKMPQKPQRVIKNDGSQAGSIVANLGTHTGAGTHSALQQQSESEGQTAKNLLAETEIDKLLKYTDEEEHKQVETIRRQSTRPSDDYPTDAQITILHRFPVGQVAVDATRTPPSHRDRLVNLGYPSRHTGVKTRPYGTRAFSLHHTHHSGPNGAIQNSTTILNPGSGTSGLTRSRGKRKKPPS